jgi:YD repeat-containing protein
MTSRTDQRGLVTTFNYDSDGNVASVVASDGGITTNTYDSLNRLETVTDPLGRKTS